MPAHLAVLKISPLGEPTFINFVKVSFVKVIVAVAHAILSVIFFLKYQPYLFFFLLDD